MPKKIFTEKNLKTILRIFLGLVFIVSGMSKLLGPENFIKEIDKINFLAAFLTKPAAYTFILFELVLGCLLIFKFSNRVLIVTTVTVVILSCYLGFKVLIHDSSDCGCFGNFIYRSNLSALLQDIILLSIIIFTYSENRFKYNFVIALCTCSLMLILFQKRTVVLL